MRRVVGHFRGLCNRDVIEPLALEEANLLHARRLARRHGWWSPVISVMQGLFTLYEYQGRPAEWARLVAEIARRSGFEIDDVDVADADPK